MEQEEAGSVVGRIPAPEARVPTHSSVEDSWALSTGILPLSFSEVQTSTLGGRDPYMKKPGAGEDFPSISCGVIFFFPQVLRWGRGWLAVPVGFRGQL